MMMFIDEMKNLFNRIWGKSLRNHMKEKRNSPRKPCDIQGLYTYVEQSPVPLVIKDIGLYGMHVVSLKKLTPGNIQLVSVREDGKLFEKSRYEFKDVYMKVLWCRQEGMDIRAGLQFTDSYEKITKSWLGLLLGKYGLRGNEASYKRNSVRVSADIPVIWKFKDEKNEHYGTLVNISLQGVLLELDANIEAGKNLWLKIGPYKKLKALICHVSIVHSQHSSSVNKWYAGAKLTGLDEARMELLRIYLNELAQKS